MKYKCLGPFIKDGKTYNFGDIVEYDEDVVLKGVLTKIDSILEEIKEEPKKTVKKGKK